LEDLLSTVVVRYDVQFPMAVYSPPRDARSEEVEESGFAFKHWIEWAQRPTTGMVLGDTWMDFMRVKQHNDFLHFVADPAGPSEPVTGSVHVNERQQESFLSVSRAQQKPSAIRQISISAKRPC
jgi:hypothetical protein